MGIRKTAKCVCLRDGYEYHLRPGQEYEIKDIQPGIFSGDHYVTVINDVGRETSGHRWRFDLSKDECEEYISHKG